MTLYMDVHDDLVLPEAAIEQRREVARNGERDQHGVRQLDYFYSAEGKGFCLVDAPGPQAVRSRHEDLGVPVGEIHEVSSLR